MSSVNNEIFWKNSEGRKKTPGNEQKAVSKIDLRKKIFKKEASKRKSIKNVKNGETQREGS